MQSLLTDASSPALHPLGPPVKRSNEASASVVDARSDEVAWEGQPGNAGTCFPVDIFLHFSRSCSRPRVLVPICLH